MPNQSVEVRNFVLACYAVSLILGETILGTQIRAKTVQNYVDDAALLFRIRRLPWIPLLSTDHVKLIITTLTKYESVPNRRNMISDAMMHHLQNHLGTVDQDSNFAAIFDWLVLGRYTGARKSEWCQSTQSNFERILEWPSQPALAFIYSDFTFLDGNQRRTGINNLTNPIEIHYVRIKWRKQKNSNNDEEIDFARDYKHTDFCPVQAAVRIIQRAIRLHTPIDHPIAVYCNSAGQRRFITDTQVARLLRSTASAVHNIPPKDPSLAQWSTHSVRVTAANLLHRERFADSFIQKRLRWKSTSFLDYLRNTIYSADQHATLSLSPSNLPPMGERSYRENEPHDALLSAIAAAEN